MGDWVIEWLNDCRPLGDGVIDLRKVHPWSQVTGLDTPKANKAETVARKQTKTARNEKR